MTDHHCRIGTIKLRPGREIFPSALKVVRVNPGNYFRKVSALVWERTDLRTYVVASR